MSELTNAIRQICEEKNLSYEAVLETIESALAAAYRKDFGKKNQNVKVEFDPETGKTKIFDVKTVVEDLPAEEEAAPEDEEEKKVGDQKESENKEKTGENEKNEKETNSEEMEATEEEKKFNPKTEIQISEAKEIKKTAKIGEELKVKLEAPEAYGRMAAQTAKQVIIQKLREAEREMVYNEFKDKEREVISGVVQRREGRLVLIDLGKTVGILPPEEQISGENYRSGERIKVYVREVRVTSRGPEIIVSRTSEEILKKIFYLEIPEISNGLVELAAVAREAGSRSKVAVRAESDNVDPIGSCVGQRGTRIQTIINELGGEKVDIIEYSEEPAKFIANSLSPAKIESIELKPEEKKAIIKVLPDQLSLAIGRGGQNVRLAARLTGWKLDIVGSDQENRKNSAEGSETAEENAENKEEIEEAGSEEMDGKNEEPAGKEEKKEK